jgi:hypothetical protein
MSKTVPGFPTEVLPLSWRFIDSTRVIRLAQDDANLYWTTSAPEGSVMKMPKKGGAVSTFLSTVANDIAVDQNYVWWTTTDAVMRAPTAGGATTTFASGQKDLRQLAVGGQYVYWATYSPHGAVLRASTEGGAPVIVARNQAFVSSLVADSRGAYWTTEGMTTKGLMGLTGTVMRVSSAGSTPVTLASRQKGCIGIAVDSSNVYWGITDRSDESRKIHADLSSILTVPIRGGPVLTLRDEQAIPLAFAVDINALYWANQATGNESSAWTSPGIMRLQLR